MTYISLGQTGPSLAVVREALVPQGLSDALFYQEGTLGGGDVSYGCTCYNGIPLSRPRKGIAL